MFHIDVSRSPSWFKYCLKVTNSIVRKCLYYVCAFEAELIALTWENLFLAFYLYTAIGDQRVRLLIESQ